MSYIQSVNKTKKDNIKPIKEQKPYNDIQSIISSIEGRNTRMEDVLDNFRVMGNLGPLKVSTSKFLYGINHRQTPSLVPHNTDQQGFTFFTKPTLNLTADNIVGTDKGRILTPLINGDPKSYGRFVRCTLDPRLAKNTQQFACPLNDPFNVFIPMLSNGLTSMTAPPSTTVGVYSSQAGRYKEVMQMIDDIALDYSSYNITCTFKNIQGSPYLLMFKTWIYYASLQFLDEGPIPYMDDMMNNRINYHTRIYRLIMDPTKRYVQHIWAPAWAFPIGIETGSIFGFDNTKVYNDSMKTLDIQFSCTASIWDDPLLMEQFNIAVYLMNPNMKPGIKEKNMVRVPYNLLELFNGVGYPWINTEQDNELEWWVTKEQYKSITSGIVVRDKKYNPQRHEVKGRNKRNFTY